MKFRNPWVDPRVAQVRTTDLQQYLVGRGWKPLPPVEDGLLLFDGPGGGDGPLLTVPQQTDRPQDVQRVVEVITELALRQQRYAGDLLNDILHQTVPSPVPGNGREVAPEPATP